LFSYGGGYFSLAKDESVWLIVGAIVVVLLVWFLFCRGEPVNPPEPTPTPNVSGGLLFSLSAQNFTVYKAYETVSLLVSVHNENLNFSYFAWRYRIVDSEGLFSSASFYPYLINPMGAGGNCLNVYPKSTDHPLNDYVESPIFDSPYKLRGSLVSSVETDKTYRIYLEIQFSLSSDADKEVFESLFPDQDIVYHFSGWGNSVYADFYEGVKLPIDVRVL
jgi:hypothetical protein